MSNIRLSPKHGVNPSLALCFWCRKDRGEVVLLGKMNSTREDIDPAAPRHILVDYDPCSKCKENFALGVALIECKERPNFDNQQEIQQGLYPTGNFLVVTEDAVSRMFHPESLAAQILKIRKAFVSEEAFQLLSPQEEP